MSTITNVAVATRATIRSVTGFHPFLVTRVHVDLLRVISAACRPAA